MKPRNPIHVWVVETWVESFHGRLHPVPPFILMYINVIFGTQVSKQTLQKLYCRWWFDFFGHVTLICGKIIQFDLHIFVKWVGSAATPFTIVTIVGSTTRSGPRLLETPASQAVWTTHSEKTTCWAEGRGIAGMADGWWGVEIRARRLYLRMSWIFVKSGFVANFSEDITVLFLLV